MALSCILMLIYTPFVHIVISLTSDLAAHSKVPQATGSPGSLLGWQGLSRGEPRPSMKVMTFPGDSHAHQVFHLLHSEAVYSSPISQSKRLSPGEVHYPARGPKSGCIWIWSVVVKALSRKPDAAGAWRPPPESRSMDL